MSMTWGEFEALSPEQRRRRARQWIAQWERNYALALQMDAQADQDAFTHGIIDESPIDRAGRYVSSGTTRSTDQ